MINTIFFRAHFQAYVLYNFHNLIKIQCPIQGGPIQDCLSKILESPNLNNNRQGINSMKKLVPTFLWWSNQSNMIRLCKEAWIIEIPHSLAGCHSSFPNLTPGDTEFLKGLNRD